MDFFLSIWREASRHDELDVTIDRMAALLRPHLPADAMVVCSLHVQTRRVETVAIGMCRAGTPLAPASAEGTPEAFNRLMAWCRHGSVLQGSGDGAEPLHLLVPDGVPGDWLAVPLTRDEQPIGALLLLARAPARFDRAHHDLAEGLAEPVAVALAHDAHFHELARLREGVEAENRALLSRLERDSVTDAIVGAESGLRHVMARVNQVAPTDVPVLIFGETGSGKEVLARAIHARSRRADAPIVRVNCGAMPPGLIDSELFGHERGSFTGALTVRKGWFERADGGTLFLDEIGELPLDAQVRLLRILQDGTFERVGGQKPLKVDVRLVAATNRDLHAMVTQGAFREDLWYRISVFPIELPPLRDRPEDIAPLATHFAQRAGKRLRGAPLALTMDDIELLTSYPWPGNVRELATVIERAAILGNGKGLELQAALGPSAARPGRMTRADWARSAADAAAATGSLTLEAVIKAHITQALRATHGRVEGPFGAAARLGVNPHTLRARMRKLGIKWATFRPRSSRGGRSRR